MELTWFEYLLYGLISGFTEFLPVSAVAHQAIFINLTGGQDHDWLRFAVHLGCLAALLTAFIPMLARFRRERKIARIPRNQRRRQPDFASLMEYRLLRTAAVSMLVVFIGYRFVYDLYERLWLLAIFLIINGIVLYLPQFLPSANKTAESMSSLDGMLIGLSTGAGIIPGISRVACGTSIALIRGADRQYAADYALLLGIPALAVMLIIDCIFGVGTAVSISGVMIFGCITAAAAAFVSAYLAIYLVRFLAVRAGFSGFAYYCWGLALFVLIIYLI